MNGESQRAERESVVMTLAADKNAAETSVPAPLAKEIKRGGMLYREMFRKRDVEIYGAKGKGDRIEYEFVGVQILPAGEFNGRQYPFRESFPPTSNCGESGWTFSDNSHRDPLTAVVAKAEHIPSKSRVEDAERKITELTGKAREGA
jgi:hypothetical protein